MKLMNYVGYMIMTIIASSSLNVYANAKDDAAIKTIVQSVGLLADTGDFSELEKLYAPEVELDYSSLSGGEVELKSPQAIMTEWASILPGFDRTHHQVSNIKVSHNGKTAMASADVVAEHWVADLYWQVQGSYRYQLHKHNGVWQINAHKFSLLSEKGTREVFASALENLKNKPSGYIVRQKTRQAVLDFLHSLENKDMNRFAKVWAEDAIQEMPYSPKGFPKRVVGKANLIKHYKDWPKNSGEADFTTKLVFYPMQNPEMIFVEFAGDVDIIPTGKKYKQHYGGLFHVENGKIKLFREYFNPLSFSYAFGLNEG
ncbi:nuclear transport factor 2 family protein [Pleionea sp. CnH1-48]|uniref:nuclear transport factor 2 family protein n=1 Tax=Pleionea sp. CnH1-48 TaxID=2954494 RepID=UPI0020969E75|nr:nuclear transport factor 2 family protein [Pleionea sp. CnH1-48]MCO7223198.1 nuclear transport factor 2 family protein [Pleionea sp. CnH1-48]